MDYKDLESSKVMNKSLENDGNTNIEQLLDIT